MIAVHSRHLVVRNDDQPVWLRGPDLGDVFIGRQTAECLQSTGEVVGSHEIGKERSKLIVARGVEAFDGRLFDRAVHPLDFTIGPRMVRLGEAVFDAVRLANHVETHVQRLGGIPVTRLLCELDALANSLELVAARWLDRSGSCGSVMARPVAGIREASRPFAGPLCRPAG